jgi:hypothetical protein
MEQNPWDANPPSASVEIPSPLWNAKVHYSVRKNPPLYPVFSQMYEMRFQQLDSFQ